MGEGSSLQPWGPREVLWAAGWEPGPLVGVELGEEGTGSGKEEEKGSRHAQKGCPSEGHCREQGWRRHACLTAPGPLQRPL